METTFWVESLPVPRLDTREDALRFLEEELPEWLGLAEGQVEAGEPLPNLLLAELGEIARRAGRGARTGEPAEIANGRGNADLGPLARLIGSAIQREHFDNAAFLTGVLERASYRSVLWRTPGASGTSCPKIRR